MHNLNFQIGGIAVLTLLAFFIIGPQNLVAQEGERSEEIPEVRQDKNLEFSAYGVFGELVKIDGEFYVVKEPNSGKEVRLKVTSDTHINGTIEVGKKLMASVLPDGRVLIVTSLE